MRSAAASWLSYFRTLWLAVLLASLCGLFVRTFLVQAFRVPSESMHPALLVGDRILVNKFVFGGRRAGFSGSGLPWLPSRAPRRGDVVVLVSPQYRRYLVKRVIGLPYDQVDLEAGRLSINRTSVEEGYVQSPFLLDDGSLSLSVPAGRYFFLGDHRSQSLDSRSWGTLPARHLVGQAFVVYWSDTSDGAEPDRLKDTRGLFSWLRRCRWERFMKPVR